MRARQILMIASLALLLILSSSVSAFDISTPGSSQVGFSSSTTSLNFDLAGILVWTKNIIADFFGIPEEDVDFSNGNFFAFVLAPILLTYMMFFSIIKKLALFDSTPEIEKYIPLVLALMLAPLGVYRRFFFAVTSFFTTGTAILLYVFLFVAMFAYGYRYMFARGVHDFQKGNIYMSDIKSAKNDVEQLTRNIKEITTKIHRLEMENSRLNPTSDAKKILANRTKIDNLKDTREIWIEHVKARRKDMMRGFKKTINDD